MKRLIYTFLLLAGLAAFSPLWAEGGFAFEYVPTRLPERSVPRWHLLQKRGEEQVEAGKLAVEVPIGQRHGYLIGIRSDQTPQGDADAWNPGSGKATVDFRVRCEADFPDLEPFRVVLSDGRQAWTITFQPGKIAGKEVHTGRMETYRVTLEGDTLVLSSASKGVLYTRAGGSTSTDFSNTALIGFGTLHSNKESPHVGQGAVRWELEFFRWTNEEAMEPLGPGK